MSRPKRQWYPGAIYHVMSRGNRRLLLYQDQEDYSSFLESVIKTKERLPFRLHSLCLMSNHFHMVIETGDTELWKIMQRVLHPYAMYFNRKYHFTGHLFEHRYTACLIEDEGYFLEVSRYIHLNPVKARIVLKPNEYEYSSYRVFIENPGEDCSRLETKSQEMISELIDPSRIFSCFGNNAREEYRAFVEGKKSHAEQEKLIQKDMKEDDMWLP